MAECHPVGFQWVMEAKARGATVIHVDPRFTRTSAVADLHVPLRAGTDIAFLGGIVNYVLAATSRTSATTSSPTPTRPTIIDEDFRDTEDLDGLFSGCDPEQAPTTPRPGSTRAPRRRRPRRRPQTGERRRRARRRRRPQAARGEAHGSGGARRTGPDRDETLQHPRCVFQILKRHFARYTPGDGRAGLRHAAGRCSRRSAEPGDRQLGPRADHGVRATRVGWTQHTVGVQYIRTAAILQLLLGNIGRPGGGILALRGHASIQGSTDIPTLFDLLPGYLPDAARARERGPRRPTSTPRARTTGFWGDMRHLHRQPAQGLVGRRGHRGRTTSASTTCPRLTGSHSTYETVAAHDRRRLPRATSCSARTRRSARPTAGCSGSAWPTWTGWWCATSSLIESATFWQDGPEIETGELRTEDIGTEVFFLPAAAHTEKDGSFTNTQRMLQWHHEAVEPAGRRAQRPVVRLPPRPPHPGEAAPPRPTRWTGRCWTSPGTTRSRGRWPSRRAEAVLREINGWDADGQAAVVATPSSRTTARPPAAAGSTAGSGPTA